MTILVRDRFKPRMSNTIIPADATAGVFENPQTGLHQCLSILGSSNNAAFLSSGSTIAHTYYRGPCSATDTASHGNPDGSIYVAKATRLNPRPGMAGASYTDTQINTVPGTAAATQVSAGSFYTPP